MLRQSGGSSRFSLAINTPVPSSRHTVDLTFKGLCLDTNYVSQLQLDLFWYIIIVNSGRLKVKTLQSALHSLNTPYSIDFCTLIQRHAP